MNYSDEEKETIAHLIDMSNLSLIGDGTVIIQNETIAIVLNLIQKQEAIIDKMAEFLEDELTFDEICNKENCYADEYINGHCQKCLNCIKEYFEKVVDEDVKD